MKARTLFGALLGLACVTTRADSPTYELNLTADTEVSVPIGQTNEIYVLKSDSNYTLTKLGAGALLIGRVDSSRVRLNVVEGELLIATPTCPAVFADAVFHVDAAQTNTFVLAAGSDGIERWNDCHGGTVYAKQDKTNVGTWRTDATSRYAQLVLGAQNGLPLVDFGTLQNASAASGTGTALAFSQDITGIREAIAVYGFTDEFYTGTVGSPTAVFGYTASAGCAFMPGGFDVTSPLSMNPKLLNVYQPCTVQSRNGVFVDGVSVKGASVYPAGLHVIEYHIDEPAADATDYGTANNFARERSFSFGGIQLGEAAFFTRPLTDDEHEQVRKYLDLKWFSSGIPSTDRISVVPGAHARVRRGLDWEEIAAGDKGTIQASLVVTEDTAIDVPSGVTNEIYVLSGDAHTLTKTGPGVLKVCDIASSQVKIDVQDGEMLVGALPTKPEVFFASVIHLDAAATETVEMLDDESHVVSWTDASGGKHSAVAGAVAPKLLRLYRRGLPVVDFGSLKNAEQTAGYGGSMTFDEQLTLVRETYSVMMFTEDTFAATGSATPVFGQAKQGAFLASSLTANTWPYFFSSLNPNTAQAQGGLWVDGEHVADATRASGELQLVSFRLKEPADGASDLAMVDGLAFDRSFATGGQRIGECLVFSRALSDVERELVSNYLTVKWFPSEDWTVAQITVRPRAILSVSGPTNITTVYAAGAGGDLVVQDGSLTIDPLATREPWFHVDATAIDAADVEGGHVLTWRDVGGNGRTATHVTTKPTWRSDPENRKPMLRTAFLNGKDVVDFGALQESHIVDSSGAGVGYGAAMKWSETCSTVREVLMIVSDTEDIATIKQTYPDVAGVAPFVGNAASSSACQYFRPAPMTDGTYPGVILTQNAKTQHVWGHADGVAIDGVTVPAASSMGAGFHLVNFRSDTNATADHFAYDRGLIYGGLRYGEFMLFERLLTDDERNRLSQTLLAKWLEGSGFTYSYGNVTVASNATLRLPDANLAATGVLNVEGVVVARSVRPAVIDATPAARIDGILDLSTPGTIRLTTAVYGEHPLNERFRVLSATSVIGGISGWKVVSDMPKDGEKIVLKVGDGGLYAECREKTGLCILFR